MVIMIHVAFKGIRKGAFTSVLGKEFHVEITLGTKE